MHALTFTGTNTVRLISSRQGFSEDVESGIAHAKRIEARHEEERRFAKEEAADTKNGGGN